MNLNLPEPDPGSGQGSKKSLNQTQGPGQGSENMQWDLTCPNLVQTKPFWVGKAGSQYFLFYFFFFIAFFFASGSAIFHDVQVYLVYLCQELTQTNDSWVDE